MATPTAWPRHRLPEDLKPALPPNASLDQIIEKIRTDDVVSSEHVGFGGEASPVYDAFKRLEKLAGEAALRRLTADRSPAMRVYAFYALADLHPDAIPFEVLLARAGDIATVQTIEGCVIDEAVVRDLMLRRIESRLSTGQRTELLERLLSTAKVTPATESALRFWTVEPRLYKTLRDRATSGLSAALPAVARFRRDDDVPLIERALHGKRFDGLGAVAEFPSPKLLPVLHEIQDVILRSSSFSLVDSRDIEFLRTELPSQTVDDKSICRFYRAVLAYPPQAAEPFIERALAGPPPQRRVHALCIGAALDPAALGPSASIAFRIWEQESQLSPDLLRALWKVDQPHALRALERSFRDVNAYNYYSLLPLLVRFVREHHPTPARVLNQSIAGADASHFKEVALALGELRDPSSLPLLFDRLETRGKDGRVVVEWNPNIYWPAIQAILKYQVDAKQKRQLADWIVNRARERRAKWILDRAQLNTLEADLSALIKTHGLTSSAPSGR